jgi:hypothetical protein
MRVFPLLLLVGIAAACSNLPVTGDGIVALEILTPTRLTLRIGDSLTMQGRALNKDGDSVAATIIWQTPDTAAIIVDSLSGVVVARLSSGTGRVQARVGSLRSDLVPITLLP